MKRSHYIILSFIIPMAVYLSTVSPNVHIGDDGELIAACYSLGIAHPSGYPLFCALGKLFTFIPAGTIAFRVHLMSSVFAGLVSVLLFLLLGLFSRVARLTPEKSLSFAVSMLFAFSLTFWSQAVYGKFYPLNVFFAVLLLYYSVKAAHFGRTSDLLLFAFFAGLGLTNHHTLAAIVVLGAAYVALVNGKLFWKSSPKAIILGFIGLFFYAYLPIRAAENPAMNWGNPVTFDAIMDVIFRKQYGSFMKNEQSITIFIQQMTYYIKSLSLQFRYAVIPFVVYGIYALYKANKKLSLYILMIFAIFSVGITILINPRMTKNDLDVVEVFYLLGYLSAVIFAYFGLRRLESVIRNKKIVTVFAGFIVILPLVFNYNANDRSRNYIAYNYGLNMLKSVPKDGILFASQDNEVFILAYLKKVEKLRPDVTVYDDLGCVFENIYGGDIMKLDMAAHANRIRETQQSIVSSTPRPVCFLRTSGMYKLEGEKAKLNGVVFCLSKTKARGFESYDLTGIEDEKIFKEYMVRDIVCQYFYSMGETRLKEGKKEQALEDLKKALEYGRDVSWVSNNTGILFEKYGLAENAIESYLKATEANPQSATARYNLGVAYAKKGMKKEAVTEYLAAIKADSRYADAYNNLGNLYLSMGFYKEAISNLRSALTFRTREPSAYFNLGVALMDTGTAALQSKNGVEAEKQFEEAMTCFKQAIEIKSDYAEAYNNIAIIYFYAGNKEQAIKTWETAVRVNPNFKDAAVNLKRIRDGK